MLLQGQTSPYLREHRGSVLSAREGSEKIAASVVNIIEWTLGFQYTLYRLPVAYRPANQLVFESLSQEIEMAIQCTIDGQTYVFDVDYGEEELVARIIVRSAEGGHEGLWLVDPEGELEAGDDIPGFGSNPATRDGAWPMPPKELVRDARRIALAKKPSDSDEEE